MHRIYESRPLDSSSELFMATMIREIQALPKITFLDEYMHFRTQLEEMRARYIEFDPARFAIEMAVYSILMEYEEGLGLPARVMPKPDGKGGIEPEVVVLNEWLSESNCCC